MPFDRGAIIPNRSFHSRKLLQGLTASQSPLKDLTKSCVLYPMVSGSHWPTFTYDTFDDTAIPSCAGLRKPRLIPSNSNMAKNTAPFVGVIRTLLIFN